MNELERTALNEILRTVTYIAEKIPASQDDGSPPRYYLKYLEVQILRMFLQKYQAYTGKVRLELL